MTPGSGFGMMRCCTAQYTPPATAVRTAAVMPTPKAIFSPWEDCWPSASPASSLLDDSTFRSDERSPPKSGMEDSDTEASEAAGSTAGASTSAYAGTTDKDRDTDKDAARTARENFFIKISYSHKPPLLEILPPLGVKPS